MAGINKLTKISTAEGGMIGVANCASFGKNKITQHTGSGTVTLQSGTKLMSAALVAGGGGGESGGGGAGGLRQLTLSVCGNFPATIGGGGAAGAVGVDSSFVVKGTTYTADGGGDGGARCGVGGDGGSGGGGGISAELRQIGRAHV